MPSYSFAVDWMICGYYKHMLIQTFHTTFITHNMVACAHVIVLKLPESFDEFISDLPEVRQYFLLSRFLSILY